MMNNKKSDKYSDDKQSDNEHSDSDDDYNPTRQALFTTNIRRRSSRLNTISSNKKKCVQNKPNNGTEEKCEAGPSWAINEGQREENEADSCNNNNESDVENLSTDNYFSSSYMCTCCSAGPSHSTCFVDDSNESNAENIPKTNRKQMNKSDKRLLKSFCISSDDEPNASSWFTSKRKTFRKKMKRKFANFISSDKSEDSSSEESSDYYNPNRRHTSSEDNFSSSDEFDPNEGFDSNNPKHVRKHINQLVKDGYERIKNEMGKTTYHSIIPEERDNNFTPFSPEETAAAINHEDDDKLDSEGRIKINLDDACDFQRFVTLVFPYLPSDDEDDISNTPGFKKWSAELDEKCAKIERKRLDAKEKKEKRKSDCNKSRSERKHSEVSVNPVHSEKIEDQQEKEIENSGLGSYKPSNLFIEKQKNEVSKDEQLSTSVQSISATQQKKKMHLKQAEQINKSVDSESICKKKPVLGKRPYKPITVMKGQKKDLRSNSKSLKTSTLSLKEQKYISKKKHLNTVAKFISTAEEKKNLNIGQPKKNDVTRNKQLNVSEKSIASTTQKRRSVHMKQTEQINKSASASEPTCKKKPVLAKRPYKPIPVIKSQMKALRSKPITESRLSIKNQKYISKKKQLSTVAEFISTAEQKKSVDSRQPKIIKKSVRDSKYICKKKQKNDVARNKQLKASKKSIPSSTPKRKSLRISQTEQINKSDPGY